METPIEYLEKEYLRLYNGIVKISMLSSFETAKKMEQELKQVKNSVVLADVSISDDEIMKIAVDKVSNNNYTWNFDYGVDMAKWMRDKLLNY